ncbi:adenosylcobyric acid synthase (glutamine-hydrolysing) [Celeribacter indicus]|uniref:Cobyric acid synthase n=2 Tax=Celeribacter indicus TaxID=1208324 RepID=A0A0B5DZ20_9RHOB|nr:cobyric acid synthase [Celeribacter indicus]SDW65257.1 adenosylcobyric acid synthase (glutamine-hydrolysing) [Celeribacter indicus]
MIQGTGSNVGKSMLVAGLLRAFARRGLRVAPFKPQNMSNNAAVTEDGGEIGRAQALQARASGLRPHSDMNPVLLKPESDAGAQVIVQGRRAGTLRARDYGQAKARLLPKVLESFHRLSAAADLVVVEGAGSPAEINLRAGDIANMGFAEAAGLPVVLVGDIDRGGVIAQIVGTHAVLPPPDRDRIRAFAVNKFRGDIGLFAAGAQAIAERTGWTDLGTLPWFDQAHRLPAEDVLDISSRGTGAIRIAVPKLSRIANFDDLDPLAAEPEVRVEIVEPGRALPGDADLVLLPGSKSTIGDLAFLRAQGWDIDLMAHVRRGGHVLGICGGYQMLGRWIDDPDGIEGHAGRHAGLGLLDVTTVMQGDKRLAEVEATDRASGTAVTAYEIHIGRTEGPDCARAWLTVEGRPEGAGSADGRVRGCYLHGLFASDTFRAAWLGQFGLAHGVTAFEDGVDAALEALADHVEAHLDLETLLGLAAEV